MQPRSKEPKVPPKIEATQFVPDAALDALYRQAVAVAREFESKCPTREEFEKLYREEITREEATMSKYQGPKRLVTQRVLRGMIRAIARDLAKDSLSVKEKLALLKPTGEIGEAITRISGSGIATLRLQADDHSMNSEIHLSR